MKKLIFSGLMVCNTVVMLAQAPQGISHQAIIRNASGELVTGTTVGITVSILQGTAGGTAVFVETHAPTSNENGLITYVIGQGTLVSGTFANIDWAAGPYFLKTEADPEGGSNYTMSFTSELLSVPYALHAKKAENVPTGTVPGEMQYWNGSEWLNIPPGSTGQVLTFIGGMPIWATSIGVGDVANGTTGKIWMDRNLGAIQVATSSTDFKSYGHLYQWGRGNDGHQNRNSGTTTTLSSSDTPGHSNFIMVSTTPYDWRSPQNNNLWQGVNGINNPCPNGYRLPTWAEWDEECLSWISSNAAGAFASPLKLPLAGQRLGSNGSIGDVGSFGLYWSSSLSNTNSINLYFREGPFQAQTTINNRSQALSVRCIKN